MNDVSAPSGTKNSFAIPIAIIIAAALIGAAIFFSGNKSASVAGTGGGNEINTDVTPPAPVVEPVTEDDHIRGNPNAPIMIVEYSDYDCPFCKNFHETMNRVMDNYGVNGQVAWTYRHFPLQQLHPNAPKVAEAAECVAEQGGNDAFWAFSDLVFGERETNAPTDLSRLNEFAERSGVDVGQFELCYNNGKFADAINEDIQAALAAGGQGTPHSIVMVGDQQGVINGAQPYEVVKQIVDNLIAQMEGQAPAEGTMEEHDAG